jgi:hypothetical protein
MKTKLRSRVALVGLLLAVALFSDFTCSEEEEDSCAATKMVEAKEPLIYLMLELKQFTLWAYGTSFNSQSADEGRISGSITKYYCPDKKSGSFEFEQTFYPALIDPQALEQGLYLDQTYFFKFENDLDYLEVPIDIFLVFQHQNLQWKDTVRAYYSDLQYDYTLNSKYIPIVIDDSPYDLK